MPSSSGRSSPLPSPRSRRHNSTPSNSNLALALSPKRQLQLYCQKLENAIRSRNIAKLIQFSTTQHGYVNNNYRRQIYMILLRSKFPHIEKQKRTEVEDDDENEKIDDNESTTFDNDDHDSTVGVTDREQLVEDHKELKEISQSEKQQQPFHEYLDQVEKDVSRSLYKFVSDLERSYLRAQLSDLVNYTLSCPMVLSHDGTTCTPPSPSTASMIRSDNNSNATRVNSETDSDNNIWLPHYYQGYHELCSVLMLTLGSDLSQKILTEYLIPHRTYLRTSMETPTLEPILHQLNTIYSILYTIGEVDYALYLKQCDMDQGHYALSWILTWYCHVVDELHVAQKLLDSIIAHGSEFCVYIAVSIVLYRKNEVMYRHGSSDLDEPSEPEFTEVFAILNRIPNEWCHEIHNGSAGNSSSSEMTVWDHLIQQAVLIRDKCRQKKQEAIAAEKASHHRRRSSWIVWATLAISVGMGGVLYYTQPKDGKLFSGFI